MNDSILCNCDDSINSFTLDHVTVTSYVFWQTSFFGDHYLASDSPYRGAGSTTADQVGLYWYTTQTSQVPQGASQVDLGYHYRATDSNGNPINDNGDGGNWSAVSITTQPVSQTVSPGSPVTFSVAATGTTPLTYQWRFNGNNISGATSSSYSISSAQTANAGSYAAVVGNPFGSATSSTATLTLPTPPSITSQPTPQVVDPGRTASFSVTATGSTPLSYQWQLNGNNIGGANSSSFTISSAQASDAGTYTVVVANAVGTATSSGATLTVNAPPTITSQPSSQTVDIGMAASFSVTATGAGYLYYQWYLNGNSISGANGSTFSIACAQASDAGTYSVIVWNYLGSTTSGNATLTLNTPIQFDISFANQCVNQANVPLSLDIQAGTPLYYTVLLDNTGFSSASWTNYTSSNIAVNLGSTQGWHTVWVGLCDMLNGVRTWSSVRLELLVTPPAITITSPGPGTNTVDQPILQLQGYAPEELSSVTYDISNAAGTLTGQPAVVLSRHYDTNLGQFTTNTFQAFDLDLTVGANHITLHAKDMAGNVSTSNYTYTLDYSRKTNPPVIGLYWPQNGAQICGTSFTWRGWVGDPTVSVSAQIADSNGDINEVDGIVERNGNFWLEDLPLASGTNWLTLTATDAVGNTNATNISVVQSLVNMAITYVPDITDQTTVQVGGTVDSGCTVWVNGVQATNFGNGSWLAYNVPVNGAGTAVFEAMAVASSVSLTGGGNGTNSTLQNTGNPTPNVICPLVQYVQDKKPAIICTSYAQTSDVLWTDAGGNTNDNFITEQWALATPGSSSSYHWINYVINNGQGAGNPSFNASRQVWDAFGNGSTISYDSVQDNDYSHATTNSTTMDMTGRCFTPEESCYQASTPGWTSADFIYPDYHPSAAVYTVKRNVASSYELQTGGKAASYRQSLLGLGVTAQNITPLGNPWPTPVTVPYNNITVMGQSLDSDNELDVVEPNGIFVPIPVAVPGSSSFLYAFAQPPPDYTPQISFNGRNVANKNVKVIVGEQIDLTCLPSGGTTMSNFRWTVGGTVETSFNADDWFGTLSNLTETTSSNISFFWVYKGSYKVTCTAVVAGKTIATTTTFNVVRPTGIITTFTGPIAVDSNYYTGFALHFGDVSWQPGHGGILFSNFVGMPWGKYNRGNTNYNIEWVQLVNSYSRKYQTNDGSGAWYQTWPPLTNSVLDTEYPYLDWYPTWHETVDAPSASCANMNTTNAPYQAVYDEGSFTMFLLFRPANGNYVPLANVDWYWNGSAVRNQVATNGNYWSLTGSDHSPNNRVRNNTTGYPQWTDNAKWYYSLTNTP